jgi:restriction system protein
MAVPSFKYFIRPCLESLESGSVLHWKQVQDFCVDALGLTEEDLEELVPSGVRTRVADRVQWALTYLRQAGLIEKAGRGKTRITDTGLEYLPRAPEVITPSDLKREFPAFADFAARKSSNGEVSADAEVANADSDEATPEERMSAAHAEHEDALAEEVLEAVRSMTPARFERLIVQVLLALGYGGTEESGRTLGRSGDEGVDGVIDMDKLGLEQIYLQAKRWTDNSVGRKEVQAFVGALSGQGATKGVFITSSTFTQHAIDYARDIKTCSLSLVDGIELARLMIKNDIGVSTQHRYELKKLDSDFFDSNQG